MKRRFGVIEKEKDFPYSEWGRYCHFQPGKKIKKGDIDTDIWILQIKDQRETKHNRRTGAGWNNMVQTLGAFTPISINLISQGNGFNQRRTNKIYAHSCKLRFAMQFPESTSSSPIAATGYYVAVVLDRQPNGAGLNTADFIDQGSSTNAMNVPNIEDKPRYNLLFEKVGFMHRQTNTVWNSIIESPEYTNDGRGMVFEVVIPLGFHINYTGTSGTIADVLTNNVSLVCVADTNTLQFDYFFDIMFLEATTDP